MTPNRRSDFVSLSMIVTVAAVSLALAAQAPAADVSVSAKTLKILDQGAGDLAGKVVWVAKDVGIDKGVDGDPAEIDATLEVFYAEDGLAGPVAFAMPQGAGWLKNDGSAKYVDKTAPSAGAVAKALVKPGKVAKVVAKATGDAAATAIDLVAGGEPSPGGGIVTRLTVYNRIDRTLHRVCSRFATDAGSTIVYKVTGGGTGAKLIAKNGVPFPCPHDYGDDSSWLCRPGMVDDQCFANSLDATEILPDLSTVFEAHSGDTNQPYDCFYVYPTVHLPGPVGNYTDHTDISLELDPVLSHVGRFTDSCRVFVPLYRQITLPTFASPDSDLYLELAYRDVKAAWDEYMASHNGGRDIVVMGHSQGTQMTARLMAEEFDTSAALRDQLIAGLLIGGGIWVPDGQVVGGTFQNMPLCTSAAEVGCIIAFRTYAESHPPELESNSIGPAGADTACTNPGALGGGEALYEAYFDDTPNQLLFQVAPPLNLGTDFIKYVDFYAGECVRDADDHSYLEIRARPGVGDLRTDTINYDHIALDPSFLGTHVLDWSFPTGELMDLVEMKAAAMP